MIIYFYNLLYKNKLNTALNKHIFFFETSKLLFTQFIVHNKHFFNIKFLFYSILNFYNGVCLILEQQGYLCIVFEKTNIDILQILFQASNFGLINEDIGIPGLLSNHCRVCQGLHYALNVEEKNIRLVSIPDFFLLCSTERPLLLHETNMQLIPQFVAISRIITTLEKYFIPLFTPKLNIKKNNMEFLDIQKILMTIKKNNVHETIISRILKISTIEKYFITTKLKNLKNYLIYLIFLSVLAK